MWARRRNEPGSAAAARLTEPYRIAYLRDGARETLRVVVISLISRQQLHVVDASRVAAAPGSQESVSHPLERGILERCRVAVPAAGLIDADLIDLAEAQRDGLEQQGLLPNDQEREARAMRAAAAIAVLGLVGVLKIVIALSRGKSNVLFLVVLIGLGVTAVITTAFPRLTRRGRRTLEDLRYLLQGLRQKVQSYLLLAPADAALLTAVYGVAEMSGVPALAYAKTLFGVRRRDDGEAGELSLSFGSSDGGGSGSSGGDGGDGGCGGGCGGCGGD